MEYPKIETYKNGRIHFIGIGGTSMHGLALMLQSLGYTVTGSDRGESNFTERLQKAGIPVMIGQKEENVQGASLVVFSAAIKPENPERAGARRLGIPELERSELLGQISAHYRQVVGVAGCHGKTTMSSMLAKIAMDAGLDPTVHVGGFVDLLGGGVRLGHSPLFVTEACEYVDSYLHLHPTVEIVSNIDNDHLDYFKTEENIYKSFESYVSLLPQDGLLIVCADDEKAGRLGREAKAQGRRVAAYGIGAGDWRAKNITADHLGDTAFDVLREGEFAAHVTLLEPGDHNVRNALAAIAAAAELGVLPEAAAKSLESYRLTRRRFERMGSLKGARVFHDYAHHPAEIGACLQGAKSVCAGRVIAVFQCNSYTRAKTLFSTVQDLRGCFDCAALVLVPDIYPGREVDTGLVHAKDMVAAINESGVKAEYLPTFEEIRARLDEVVQPEDVVVTLGSGDVYKKTALLLDAPAEGR